MDTRTDPLASERVISTRLRWMFLVLVTVGCLITACGGRAGRPAAFGPVAADSYPHESLEDWVTYGDAVVVGEVVTDVPIPPSEEEIAAGEGLVLRRITVAVDEVIWQRAGARAVPSRVQLVTMGWSSSAIQSSRGGEAVGEDRAGPAGFLVRRPTPAGAMAGGGGGPAGAGAHHHHHRGVGVGATRMGPWGSG